MSYLDFDEIQIERPIRDRLDPLTYFSDTEFRIRFRLQKSCVIILTRSLEEDLVKSSERGKPILPMLQVLVALRFFADGSVHRVGCDIFKISESSVCRIVHRVAKSICLRRNHYISFPDVGERDEIKHEFFQEQQFPGK